MILNNISLIFVLSAAISLVLSVYTYKRNQKPLSTTLSLLLGATSIWSLFYGIEISANSLHAMRICLAFEYIGITSIPVLWFLYAARYSRYDSWLNPITKSVFFLIPVVTLFMVITNQYHHLFYSISELGFSNNMWFHNMVPGLFYWVHIIYSYIIVIAGVVLFVRMYFKVANENRFYVGIILSSVSIPYFVSFAYISGFKPYGFLDLTPVGFLIMGIILLYGALNNKLFNVTPLALNVLFDSMPDAIFVFDENFEMISSNPCAQEILRQHFEDKPQKLKLLISGYKQDCNGQFDFKEINLNRLTYKITCKKIYNNKNKSIGKMIIWTDITSAKEIELKLKESEEQHRTLFETAQEAIVVAQDSKLVYFNPLFQQITGYTKDEIPTMNILEFVYKDDKYLIENNYNKRIAGLSVDKRYQFRIKRKNDEICWVNMSSESLTWNGRPATLNFLNDITEQKMISEFQYHLVSIADSFINTPINIIDRTINDSLKEMCLLVGADRAYIFDYDWTNETCRNTYEWCNVNIIPEIDNLQEVPISLFPDLIDAHTNNESFYIGNVNSMKQNDEFREMLELQGIKSLLTIPLLDNNCCIGFVGFDYVLKYHKYSEKEKSLLQMYTQMLVNVTNRVNAHELIAERIESQKLISEISTDFISAESSNLDSKINDMLMRVGKFFKVERTYILRYSEDGMSESNTNEWCANDIAPQINNLKDINISVYPWWKKHMDTMKVINIPDVSALPPEAITEKTEFERQDIKSILCVPVIIYNRVIGFLGLDAVNNKVTWSENQINLIQILANTLGDAIIKVKSEIDLRKSIKLAEAASIAKSDFLSNMSHEIRTPLNGVIGFTDLLRNTNLNKIQKDYLDNAITSANSLLGVISDILDFSKIEAGKLELDLLRHDIVELVESTADIIKVHAATKGLEILLNIQPDIPRFAIIDTIRLKQIVINLLSNAIKFTHKGEVELKLSFDKIDEKNGRFNIQVRDTGIGVKDEDKSKLFKAFSQADTSTTRRYGGTGLGLIISNSLALKMGGQIKLESEFGKGSVFSFSIQTEYEYGKVINNNSISHIKNVLVIDDNANNRMILEHNFKHWDILFHGVENGLEAIKILENSNNFDLIIIDFHMPDLNGIETIQIMRDKKLIYDLLPVILLHSSFDDAIIHKKAVELNIKSTLSKPIKSNELYNYLKNLKQDIIEENNFILPQNESIQNTTKIIDSEVKVLIAEDTQMNMLVIGNMLRNFIPKVQIFEATNGEEALILLESISPDLILMDVQMPVMDGIVATEKIKSNSKKSIRDIPVIALTAGVSKEERENCFKVGMTGFLSKPIDREVLHDKVIAVLNKNSDSQQNYIQNESNHKVLKKHFDKENLLRKIGHNSDLYTTLINIAKVEYPNYLEKIKTAFKQNDNMIIKSTAHTLKGSAYNMEFKELGDLASEIEMNVGNFKELDEIINKITVEWQTIHSMFE